jgi:hypothetical protein
MIRTTLTALVIAGGAFATPALADTTQAYCELVRDNGEMLKGNCTWSQRQGNVSISNFNNYAFDFPAAEQGKTYERINREGAGPSFKRPGYVINVYWEKPAREPGGF